MSSDNKVLILGHGWRMWRSRYIPRSAAMPLEEWNHLVQNAKKENLVFLDFDENEEPDILENIGNDWSKSIPHHHLTFDVIIDAVSPAAGALKCRTTDNYWNSVKYALKDDGLYIGWNDDPQLSNSDRTKRHIRLRKKDIDAHISTAYSSMFRNDERQFRLCE